MHAYAPIYTHLHTQYGHMRPLGGAITLRSIYAPIPYDPRQLVPVWDRVFGEGGMFPNEGVRFPNYIVLDSDVIFLHIF